MLPAGLSPAILRLRPPLCGLWPFRAADTALPDSCVAKSVTCADFSVLRLSTRAPKTPFSAFCRGVSLPKLLVCSSWDVFIGPLVLCFFSLPSLCWTVFIPYAGQSCSAARTAKPEGPFRQKTVEIRRDVTCRNFLCGKQEM